MRSERSSSRTVWMEIWFCSQKSTRSWWRSL